MLAASSVQSAGSSQTLAGVVATIIRPMLAARSTFTEAVQQLMMHTDSDTSSEWYCCLGGCRSRHISRRPYSYVSVTVGED